MQNAWVLAYLTFSRFAYLLFLFPYLLGFGRTLYAKYEAWRDRARGQSDERRPLVRRSTTNQSVQSIQQEANHFDVSGSLVRSSCDAERAGRLGVLLGRGGLGITQLYLPRQIAQTGAGRRAVPFHPRPQC